jgi:MFS family permease
MLGLFAFGTTTTVLTASLKEVAEGLDSTTTVLAWTVTAPFLALGVATPVFGKIGDIFGRRRFYLGGMAVFAAATVASAFAPDAATLIALRALAGLGAAASMPNGTALILDRFTVDERPRAIGVFNLIATGAPAVGLVLGGPMVQAFGWRSVFGIYGVISVLGLILAVPLVPRDRGGVRVPVDLAGSAALGTATLGLMLGMTAGARLGFAHPTTLAVLAMAPVGVVWFVRAERRAPSPLVPLDYFRRPNFAGPLAGFFFGHVAYMGAFVITPILLDEVFGYALSAATAILLLRPLSFSLASPVGGQLTTRLGERRTSILSSGAMVFSMGLFALGASIEAVVLVVAALSLSGVCLGLCSPAYMSALTDAAEPGQLGLATGMLTTAANLGTVVGIQTGVLALGSGDPHAATDFAVPYLLGAIAAGLMTWASTRLRPVARTHVDTGRGLMNTPSASAQTVSSSRRRTARANVLRPSRRSNRAS